MSLKSRLGRLNGAGLAPSAPPPSQPPPLRHERVRAAELPPLFAKADRGARVTQAPSPSSSASPSSPSSSSSSSASSPPAMSSTLDELRKRMDAILSREQKPRTLPQVNAPELPFCLEDTPAGPLHVRTLRLSGAHRVGRAPATAARRASSELLALLALDPRLAPCDVAGALYLDTETTGLGPGAGTVAFLVGLAFFDDDHGLVVEQLLVRQLGEEEPVLARVAERLARASMLVTFNGKSFDMPVLRTRFVMARKEMPPEPPHLDLLHVARRLHKARGFGATLGAVEREILGFVREDDVPSGEVSQWYLHFLRTGDTRGLLGVIDHNAWDVVTMAAMVGLYGEPLEGTQLAAEDLVGVARTLARAGEVDRAYAVADEAHARGAGHAGLKARAEIAKARGDKARALADFETLAESVDDPMVRLELAKLYEHHAKDATRALTLVQAGTSEKADRSAHRVARLQKKVEKALAKDPTRKLF